MIRAVSNRRDQKNRTPVVWVGTRSVTTTLDLPRVHIVLYAEPEGFEPSELL